MTSHTKKWKAEQVLQLQQLADQYSIIAIASLQNFPGALAKELRKKLQGKAIIKVTKTRIIKKALENSKHDISSLNEHLKGSVAVIFSEINPFELYSLLKKNSVNMPAKAGLIAPNDIEVLAGDTGIPPGPALSDLKAAGLKTVMQGATISIAENKIVAKKGEVISKGVSGALSKLGIKPIKVSLSITSALENGQLYLGEVLNIDIDATRQNFAKAAKTAFNIAIETVYFTNQTMAVLITKGYKNAKAVALEANILNPATVEDVLAKANAQASVLKAKIPNTMPEKTAKEEKAGEEKKTEEKPAEEKAEKKPAEKEPVKEEKAGEKTEEKPAEEKAEKKPAEKEPVKEEKAGEKTEEKPAEEKKTEEKKE